MLTLLQLPEIKTPNLLLRELQATDVRDLAGFMMQPRYQRFIVNRLRHESEVKAFVERHVASQGDKRRHVFHLAAEERHSNEVVGDGFLIAQSENKFEIGWGLHPALWQAGFGTEIGQALMGIAFERLSAKTVWCKIMKPNRASSALALRLGMELMSTTESMSLGHGRIEDVEFYSQDAASYFNAAY
ncbi:MAG: GNAT family N-acetyltransferase [Aestuariivirga sp.]